MRPTLRHLSHAPPLYAWTSANIPGASPPSPTSDAAAHRIYILGIGNLGRLFAATLATLPSPPPMTLILRRPELLAKWHAPACSGIRILPSELTAPKHLFPKDLFDVQCWSESPPPTGPRTAPQPHGIANLIVATKTPAALASLTRLRDYLAPRCAVLCAQNGVSPLWPPRGTALLGLGLESLHLLACVTAHALYSVDDFTSVHASSAPAFIGPVMPLGYDAAALPPETHHLVRCLVAAPGLRARAVASPELWLLQLDKLAVNTTINPLTAVLRCKNGRLFDDAHHDAPVVRVAHRLLQETCLLLHALVSHPDSAPIINSYASVPDLLQRYSVARLYEAVRDVATSSAANTSSMLQDVQADRPTEIGELNSWLIDTAARLNPAISLPTHAALVDLVRDKVALTKEELATRLL